jgi:hypothetical protein
MAGPIRLRLAALARRTTVCRDGFKQRSIQANGCRGAAPRAKGRERERGWAGGVAGHSPCGGAASTSYELGMRKSDPYLDSSPWRLRVFRTPSGVSGNRRRVVFPPGVFQMIDLDACIDDEMKLIEEIDDKVEFALHDKVMETVFKPFMGSKELVCAQQSRYNHCK